MTQKKTKSAKKESSATPEILSGWPAIARYLGQPVSVAQRWGKEGMPVQRKGRSMTAKPDELAKWLGREAGSREPVHIAHSTDDDLVKELRRGLNAVRGAKK